MSRPSRRTFLIAGGTAVAAATAGFVAARFTGAPALLGLGRKSGPRITGGWGNESAALGHPGHWSALLAARRVLKSARLSYATVAGPSLAPDFQDTGPDRKVRAFSFAASRLPLHSFTRWLHNQLHSFTSARRRGAAVFTSA